MNRKAYEKRAGGIIHSKLIASDILSIGKEDSHFKIKLLCCNSLENTPIHTEKSVYTFNFKISRY